MHFCCTWKERTHRQAINPPMHRIGMVSGQFRYHIQSQLGLCRWIRQSHVAVRIRQFHATEGAVAKDWQTNAEGYTLPHLRAVTAAVTQKMNRKQKAFWDTAMNTTMCTLKTFVLYIQCRLLFSLFFLKNSHFYSSGPCEWLFCVQLLIISVDF